MELAIIGVNKSSYACKFLQGLLRNMVIPKYVIIEDFRYKNLTSSAYYIDSKQFPDIPYKAGQWDITEDESSLISCCVSNNISFFVVDSHNGMMTRKLLTNFPIDILLITEGPIIKGPVLYLPKLCIMNIHCAPLPQYRGNWTTRLSLYNDEPPTVSAHVVTPWIDQGAVIRKLTYNIYKGCTIEEVDSKALDTAVELASIVLKEIDAGGIYLRAQRIWEGIEYKGKKIGDEFYPAMPSEMQKELKSRFDKCEYGFFADNE